MRTVACTAGPPQSMTGLPDHCSTHHGATVGDWTRTGSEDRATLPVLPSQWQCHLPGHCCVVTPPWCNTQTMDHGETVTQGRRTTHHHQPRCLIARILYKWRLSPTGCSSRGGAVAPSRPCKSSGSGGVKSLFQWGRAGAPSADGCWSRKKPPGPGVELVKVRLHLHVPVYLHFGVNKMLCTKMLAYLYLVYVYFGVPLLWCTWTVVYLYCVLPHKRSVHKKVQSKHTIEREPSFKNHKNKKYT